MSRCWSKNHQKSISSLKQQSHKWNLSDKTFLKGLQLVEAGLDGNLKVILVHFSSKFNAATSPSSPMKGSMNVLLKQPSHSF